MGYSKLILSVSSLELKMAANVRIPQKNLAFLQIFTQFRGLSRTEKYSEIILEAYSYPEEFLSNRGGKLLTFFCEKDEVHSSHDGDAKLKSGDKRLSMFTMLVFIIVQSGF